MRSASACSGRLVRDQDLHDRARRSRLVEDRAHVESRFDLPAGQPLVSRAQVDQVFAELRDAGAEILQPPKELDYFAPGYYSVAFRDPDGGTISVRALWPETSTSRNSTIVSPSCPSSSWPSAGFARTAMAAPFTPTATPRGQGSDCAHGEGPVPVGDA